MSSCSAVYGQCGGTGWTGPTCCVASTCILNNSWYSQCLPSTVSQIPSPSPTFASTVAPPITTTASTTGLNWTPGAFCVYAANCDWPLQDLSNQAMPDGSTCSTVCHNTSGCTHFTWTDYAGGTCWMKQGPVDASTAVALTGNGFLCGYLVAPTTSTLPTTTKIAPSLSTTTKSLRPTTTASPGPIQSWSPGAFCLWANNCDWLLQDLSDQAMPDGSGCSTACHNTLGCTHFSWTDYAGGTCFMKSGPADPSTAFVKNGNGYLCGYLTPPSASDYLWPAPRQITDLKSQVAVSAFQLSSNADASLTSTAFNFLTRSLASKQSAGNGVTYNVLVNIANPQAVTSAEQLSGADESYTLSVLASGATITAPSKVGAVYALQTLSQLITSTGSLVLAQISDSPRFSYRGLLFDTSRNFFPPEDMRRVIDGMFMSKMNVIHWHLYDAQSFSLQWDAHPELSYFGAYRNADGSRKVYTKSDVQAMVQYAFQKNVRIIPEFDLPGHSAVFGFSGGNLVTHWNSTPWDYYCVQPPCGQLDPRNSRAMQIIHDLITDVGSWFKDPFIHVGHDELPGNAYDGSNVKDVLRAFEPQLTGYLNAAGKKYAAWDEVVGDYGIDDLVPKDALITVWRSPSSPHIQQAASSGFKNIVVGPSDVWYLDCSPSATWCQTDYERQNPQTSYNIPGFVTSTGQWHTWQSIYAYDPLSGLDASSASAVKGGFGALWSETIKRHNLDRYLFPRLSAIGERLWSYDAAPGRTDVRLARFRASLVNEARIGAADLNYLGNGEGMVYRPELCDGASGWQTGSYAGGQPGNPVDSGDYCKIASKYRTNDLVYSPPARVDYGY
ncbi:glycoside hydrolase superfamily [Chytriomyces sp. MP71]|nr:glycoside hydrolase superfamily [Chytriomyces sp. MP71]